MKPEEPSKVRFFRGIARFPVSLGMPNESTANNLLSIFTSWKRIAIALALATVAAVAPASSASAETVVKYNKVSFPQHPGLDCEDMKRASFTYGPRGGVVIRTKLAKVTKKCTRLNAFVSAPNGEWSIYVATRYNREGRRVTTAEYSTRGDSYRLRSGIATDWNFARDAITVRIAGKHTSGRRVDMFTYAVRNDPTSNNADGGCSATVRRG